MDGLAAVVHPVYRATLIVGSHGTPKLNSCQTIFNLPFMLYEGIVLQGASVWDNFPF